MSTETQQQECPMNATPQREHEWLMQLVGEWTCESECSMGPGQPSVKMTGTESVRSIGDVWIIAEGRGQMPKDGGPATTIMTIGYDPLQKRYVGTFIGSMMTHLWVYDGEMDADEKVLTLRAEGPGMNGDGSTTQYKDIIEIKSDDHRMLTSHMLGDDGQWHQFMTAHYRRVS